MQSRKRDDLVAELPVARHHIGVRRLIAGAPTHAPQNWDYVGLNPGTLSPSTTTDPDPLVGLIDIPQREPGAPDASQTAEICTTGASDGRSLEGWFERWSDATMLEEFDGWAWDCVPCQQYRIVSRSLAATDQFGFGLRAGPAMMQWIWICARQDAGDAVTRLGLTVDYGGDELYSYEALVVHPDDGLGVSIRARQSNPTEDIRLWFWRGEEQARVTDSTIDLIIAGRIGKIGAELPPWQTDL